MAGRCVSSRVLHCPGSQSLVQHGRALEMQVLYDSYGFGPSPSPHPHIFSSSNGVVVVVVVVEVVVVVLDDVCIVRRSAA